MYQPKGIDWLGGYQTNKQTLHMFCKQETYLRPKDTYRLKEREWEKSTPCKWKSKASWSSNTHIRKFRL